MKKLTAWSLVLLLCISLIPTFIPAVKASPSTWYIAKTGSDTTGTGSIENPFASLRKAINRASNGDTIYIRGGNYNNVISSSGIHINRSGISRAQPFTIMAYNHEKAIINGNGINLSAGYGLLNCFSGSTYYKNITIRDLYIENSSWDGIKVGGETTSVCKDIQIINCTINNVSHHAIYFYTSDASTGGYIENVTVRDCHFWKSQTSLSLGECITFSGVHNYAFYNNTVLWGSKILVDSGNGCKNGLIYNNTFHLNSSYSGEAIYCDGGLENDRTVKNVSIYNNLIWGYQTTTVGINCIGLCGEGSGGHLENINIYNNIINVSCNDVVDPNSFIHGIEMKDNAAHDSTMANITIKYNTVVIGLGVGRPFRCGLYRKNAKNIIVANNIFITNESRVATYQVSVMYMNITDENITMYNNLYNCTTKPVNTNWNGATHQFEASAVKALPLFVNRKVGNFHLNATSPAINAASSSYIVSADFDGVTRPRGTGYDIGAYEYRGLEDSTPPVISQEGFATSNPLDTLAGYGWENFTCVVTDNVEIAAVLLKLTNPDQSITNALMTKKTSTTTYYSNRSLNLPGNYSYIIQATDTSNNVALSSSHMFSLPSNWDINNNGVVTILDLVLVANHYDETGGPGWIREDMDNNGVINALDIVLVSSHFGESWWV